VFARHVSAETFLLTLMQSRTLEEVAVKLLLPLDEVIARATGRLDGLGRRPRVSPRRFAQVWNHAPSAEVVALVLRRSVRQVVRWEGALRRLGIPLKWMPYVLPRYTPSEN
jgi:hypothetical protein